MHRFWFKKSISRSFVFQFDESNKVNQTTNRSSLNNDRARLLLTVIGDLHALFALKHFDLFLIRLFSLVFIQYSLSLSLIFFFGKDLLPFVCKHSLHDLTATTDNQVQAINFLLLLSLIFLKKVCGWILKWWTAFPTNVWSLNLGTLLRKTKLTIFNSFKLFIILFLCKIPFNLLLLLLTFLLWLHSFS